MPLVLYVGGTALDVRVIQYVRAMGQPVRWRFLADVAPAIQGRPEEGQLADALAAGPAFATAVWNPEGVEICSQARIVGAMRGEFSRTEIATHAIPAHHQLTIEAEGTSVEQSPDPFVPRRRVHNVKNMQDLVEKFSGVAKPLRPLRADLRQLTFPDGDKTSIIQDGQSDWEFLGHILHQCGLLSPGAPWYPLTLLGSVDQSEGTAGSWVISAGTQQAYESWGETTLRQDLLENEAGSYPRVGFGRFHSGTGSPEFPCGTAPSPVFWRMDRSLTGWNTWKSLDVPRFTQSSSMIWKVEDTIHWSGDDSKPVWNTAMFVSPPHTRAAGPFGPRSIAAWVGYGKVSNYSATEPWIAVDLPGFASGENKAHVRLTTPYSGKNGTRGLHYVPEDGREISVVWSGRFGDSVVLGGDTRHAAAEFPSPSFYLESTHEVQCADTHAHKLGNITVDSSLSLAVKQSTDVKSSQQLKINADGADLKMSGGTVYTGRGM